MNKLMLAALLFGLSGQAMAAPLFDYTNPPITSGKLKQFLNRDNAVEAQKYFCSLEGNIYKRFARYKQNGMTESQAVARNAQFGPASDLPGGIALTEQRAERAIYQGHQYAGLTPDQVRGKKIRDCIRAHPVPAG